MAKPASSSTPSRALPFIIGIFVLLGIGLSWFFLHRSPAPSAEPAATPSAPLTASPSISPSASPLPSGSPAPMASPDLSTDANGLSKTTAVVSTTQGILKFKFYPKDAPNTVARVIELIQQGFYNGLAFHKVVPGFIVQTGNPTTREDGGSGKSLKAEFNERRHVEGTLGMARGKDPDSADSQFYITIKPQPHLDRSYTVFGQVTEGLDILHKIQAGDKVTSIVLE